MDLLLLISFCNTFLRIFDQTAVRDNAEKILRYCSYFEIFSINTDRLSVHIYGYDIAAFAYFLNTVAL